MKSSSRVFLAGHTGLAGSAILRRLKSNGYKDVILRTHGELDLIDQSATLNFLKGQKPDVVILAAAKVGNMSAQSTFPTQFLFENLAIQNNVIRAALAVGVKELLFFGSNCIYPQDCSQPIKEDDLFSGPVEDASRPFAFAKLAGIELCWSSNRQYGTRFLVVLPANLYGPGDNYDKSRSHVIPGLLRRIHEAKTNQNNETIIWGTGTPRREFLHSDDLAVACIFLMENLDTLEGRLFVTDIPPVINIGVGNDLSIAQLASHISEIVGFRGELKFDKSKSDGVLSKLLDVTKITDIGWEPKLDIVDGIRSSYLDFLVSLGES